VGVVILTPKGSLMLVTVNANHSVWIGRPRERLWWDFPACCPFLGEHLWDL